MDTQIKQHNRDIHTALILTAILLGTRLTDIFPWWSFVIPVLITGVVITWYHWKVHSFFVGFITGFTVWTGVSLWFCFTSDSLILLRFGWSAGAVILLASGLIGGILTALALYTGKSIVSNKKKTLSL
ncbi:hypothetical protein ECE50_029530 [Chitinophaga sp. Mgbs1]|uniref:Uncharacterized protein n=1 Tax=Chitinophaga solisilvae TaxID=1233460 RepID=A0A433WPX7_9BACT|nr:hypothetical protein [Chitinophaga solisilvae]